jgi:hypothetical protein
MLACTHGEPLPDPAPPPAPRISDADLPGPEEGLADTEPTVVLELGNPVELPGGPRVTLRELVMRRIEDEPPDWQAPVDGGEVEAVIDFDTVEVRLLRSTSGYEADATRWAANHRITLLEVEPGARGVGLKVERVTARPVGAPLPLRLPIQEEVELPDGSYVRLLGHDREHAPAGVTTTPLLAELMFWVWGGDFNRQSIALEGNGATFTFRALKFTLRGYEFDRWMDVEVQKLALEAVRVRQPK